MPAAPPTPAFQVNLHCRDVGKEFEYLTGTLGLQPEFRVRGPEGQVQFAGVRTRKQGKPGTFGRIVLGDIHEALHGHYDHGEFGRQMERHPLGTGAVVYCYVRDVDAAYERARARGAVVDEPPTDQFWGDRTVSVVTPSGYYVTLATPIEGFRFPPEFQARMEDLAPRPARRRAGPKGGKARARRAKR